MNSPNNRDASQVPAALAAALLAIAAVQAQAKHGIPRQDTTALAHSALGYLLAFVTRSSRK